MQQFILYNDAEYPNWNITPKGGIYNINVKVAITPSAFTAEKSP